MLLQGTSMNQESGGHLNIKMLSHQYKDSHYKDKMISWPSYLFNRNPHIWKDGLYIETAPMNQSSVTVADFILLLCYWVMTS